MAVEGFHGRNEIDKVGIALDEFFHPVRCDRILQF